MAELMAEFHRLCEARDLAAYRVVGILDTAIYACRNENAKEALRLLTDARTRYQQADTDLENFKRQHAAHFNRKGATIRHGNRTAA